MNLIKNVMAEHYLNGAYSAKYEQQRSETEELFNEQNRREKLTERLEEFILVKIRYVVEEDTNTYMSGTSYLLIDKDEAVVHSWKSYDDNRDFVEIINHANGNRYLIYREELYGYTVFELASGSRFQYYPLCVLEGYEDFIWTNVNYDPVSNIIATEGCNWACPWSVLVSDFENPMQPPTFQKDMFGYLEEGYERYDYIAFERWNANGIVVKCFDYVDDKEVMLEVDADRLRRVD